MSPSLRVRATQFIAGMFVVVLALAPAARPVSAADTVTLRIGIDQKASGHGLNPFRALLGQDWLMFADVYDLLVDFGPNLEPEPGLAESWETSPDGLTWTFHIRQGATWQDGQPVTANDVAFTLNFIRSSEDPAYTGPWAPNGNDTNGDGDPDHPLSLFDNYLDLADGYANTRISSVAATDASTVVIKTTAPLIVLGQMYIPILPEHIWGSMTFAQAYKTTNDNPIGSGPFQVVDFNRDQAIRLVANKNYWGGAPKIDQLIYQYFDTDEAAVNALTTGSIDMISDVPTTLVSTLQGRSDITINQAPITDFVELGFNSWNPTPQQFDELGTTDYAKGPTTGSNGNPWLTLPDVRAALSQLVDKQQLVASAVNGYATPGEGLIGPADPTYYFQAPADDPATYPGDLNTAISRFQAVMATHGFADTDGNGILNVPDTSDAQAFDPNGAGQDWSLRLFVRNDQQSDIIAGGLIQSWMEQAGVNVDLQQITEDVLTDDTYPASTNADIDMYLWGWGPDPDPDFILSVFTCDQIDNWQDANYCDPAYDDMYRQSQTATDIATRQQIVHDMQQKLYTEAPYAVLWYSQAIEAYRSDRFTGFVQLPRSGGAIWGAWAYGPYGSRLSVALVGAEPTAAPTSSPVATASAEASAGPSASAVAPTPASSEEAIVTTPAPTAAPGDNTTPTGGDNTPLFVALIVIIVVLLGGGILWIRRRSEREAE